MVTLAIVAVLVAAGLQLAKHTGDSIMVTQIGKDQIQAEQLAISGINLSSLILVDDAQKTVIDSVQEAWADPNKLAQAANELRLENKALTIKITDELSKIQVNALIKQFPGNQENMDQRRIWENFLTLLVSPDKTVDSRDPAMILNSIKDWLDSGDDDAVSGISGAESDYYLGLDPPYACANGPFNHIDELLNVQGISEDLMENKASEQTDAPDEKKALNDVFTVYGQDKENTNDGGYRFPGRVNINTADVAVLAALLPEGRQEAAQDLADFREQKSEQGNLFLNPLDKGWYKKVIELSKAEQDWLDRTVTYSSDLFKVECTAQKNKAIVKLSAFLKREKHRETGKWQCRILQMERK